MHLRISLSNTLLCCAALLVGCGGARNVSIPAWQDNVEQYVKQQGRGDPAVLRDVMLAEGDGAGARRGFAMLGADRPAESTDANGVLVGIREIDGRNWFIYLVGLVKNQQVEEIRVAALSADGAGRLNWHRGDSDEEALETYRAHNDRLWKQRFPNRGAPPPEYLGFPRPEDHFQLNVTGHRVTVTHVASSARWELVLPAPRRA